MMKTKNRAILEYLYKHKAEDHLNHASLVELPNTDGVNDLYNGGYINLEFDKQRAIKKVSISGKGIDWLRGNLEIQEPNVSDASLNNDAITIKIGSELYSHIESYLKTEDYFHAVEESYKFVRARLKALTGSEKATQAFGYDANNSVDHTSLFGHEPVDAIEEDFFKGVRFLHLAVQFLRNEKSHTLATVLDKNLALHYISIASLSYDLITRNVSAVRES